MTRRRASSLFVIAGGGASSLVVALQAILLIPLYVRTVGPRVYGAWLGSGDLLNWLLLSDLGIANTLVQRVGAAKGAGDEEAEAEWFGTGLVVIGGVSLLILAVGGTMSLFLPALFGVTGEAARELRIAFAAGSAATAVAMLTNAFYGYARAVQRTGSLSVGMVVSSLASFAVALVLALRGAGLLAIAAGFAARGVVQLAFIAYFAAREIPPAVRRRIRPNRAMLRELWSTTPATAMAGLAYAAMNQSELLVASLVLGPAAATVLMLNRKAVELCRSLADSITFGSYGAFAHLVGSDDRGRALEVYREVVSVRTTLSVVMAAVYVALNAAFLSVWMGPGHYAGLGLTLLFGVQSVVAGNAFLVNYLYRAAGYVERGSRLLVAESVVRMALMVGLCAGVGMAGIPLAGVLTGAAALAYTHRALVDACRGFGARGAPIPARYWAACAGALAAGALVGASVERGGWAFLFAAGGAMAAALAPALVLSNRYLHRYGTMLAARIPLFRPTAPQ